MTANIAYPAFIPSYWGWTAYTPVIPKLYWDVYSQEERIKRLCVEYDKLTHYASAIAETVNSLSENIEDTLNEFREEITTQIAEQNQAVQEQLAAQDQRVSNALAEMRVYIDEKINEIAESQFVYDITTGTYRPSTQAMRRLFQSLSYAHKGNTQLVSYYADKTVSELSELTVYNAAYSKRATIVIDDQLPVNN